MVKELGHDEPVAQARSHPHGHTPHGHAGGHGLRIQLPRALAAHRHAAHKAAHKEKISQLRSRLEGLLHTGSKSDPQTPQQVLCSPTAASLPTPAAGERQRREAGGTEDEDASEQSSEDWAAEVVEEGQPGGGAVAAQPASKTHHKQQQQHWHKPCPPALPPVSRAHSLPVRVPATPRAEEAGPPVVRSASAGDDWDEGADVAATKGKVKEMRSKLETLFAASGRFPSDGGAAALPAANGRAPPREPHRLPARSNSGRVAELLSRFQVPPPALEQAAEPGPCLVDVAAEPARLPSPGTPQLSATP